MACRYNALLIMRNIAAWEMKAKPLYGKVNALVYLHPRPFLIQINAWEHGQ
jgi:hypothetical protein